MAGQWRRGAWIPAFAGMTVGAGMAARGVDSRFRGNDGDGAGMAAWVVDSRFRGNDSDGAGMAAWVVDSRFRGNDGAGTGMAARRRARIPAFAGMTVGAGMAVRVRYGGAAYGLAWCGVGRGFPHSRE